MTLDTGSIRDASDRIGAAVNSLVDALRNQRINQEPDFTSRMVQAIAMTVDGMETNGIRWDAKVLSDRGRGSEESQYGADFWGIADIRLNDFRVSKGFLAQAKRLEPGQGFPPRDWNDLQSQCRRMLDVSPDSFIFLYSVTGVSVVPAISIEGADRTNPHELPSRLADFYLLHFEGFVGDRDLGAPHIGILERLRRQREARHLVYLRAQG
jgi:hypothetical protein